VNQKNLAGLRARDQLLQCQRNTVIAGFSEGQLAFDPTYKYDPHCNIYDTSPKKRIPAWCDRILYQRSPKCASGALNLLHYNRREHQFSDHRPVYAIFEAKVCTINFAKRAEIEANILATLFKAPPELPRS